MATQVQQRGTTQATQEARTLAARELDINTTDGRLCVHDGSTAGGVPHVNWRDAQNQEFTYAAASGTDAITASYAKAPASRQAGQKFGFKAANNITGASTFNPNSLGAVTIKKPSGGALVDTEADDIVQNGYYEVVDNGTYYVLSGGIGSAAGGLIASATASASASLDFNSVFSAGNNYEIEFEHLIPATDNVTIGPRFTDDNGATHPSFHSHSTFEFVSTTATARAGLTTHAIGYSGMGIGSDVNEDGISGRLFIANPASAKLPLYTYIFSFIDEAGSSTVIMGGGHCSTTNGLTGFDVTATSGNLESGTVSVRELPTT